jgi:ligand-binding SRPBCC domain-containing protein
MAIASPLERATLWGHLTFNYLTEIMAEGVYERVLTYLGEPEVHNAVHRFLEEERRHALGLKRHMAEVGPTIPEPLVEGFREFSRMVGLAFALRGTGAFMDHVHGLELLGERWYGELADRFPGQSEEARRYTGYKAQETFHVEWFAEHHAAHEREARERGLESVEFASIVPAPLEEVFAFYSNTRSLPVLLGLPVACPEGVTHFEAGDRFHLRLGHGPFQIEVDTHIVEMEAPRRYVDVKTQVPFDHWEHHHHFTPLGPDTTLLSDRLLVKPKLMPSVPENLQPSPWKLGLLAMLWWRHRRTQQAFSR